MNPFIYNAQPGRVVFGAGALAHLAREITLLGAHRALVLSTPEQRASAERVAAMLGDKAAGIFDRAVMHVPIETAREAREVARQLGADCAVAVGGGSTTGLGKAIAYRTDLPQLVVPTTFAGSEMTPILGQTEAGRKTTLSSPKVLPETVIYDPELTVTMPSFIAGPSGMNAIAHAVEALYAKDRNPIVSMMAEASIRALGKALPVLMDEPANAGAHAEALYGAWLAGVCLGSVGMAIHHKICHTLGGTFNLNHADIHALMIPYTSAYNREAAPEAMARIAAALGTEDGPTGIYRLTQRAATWRSLAEMGLTQAALDKAADIAMQNPYYNPRPVTREGVREMLQAAFEGRAP